MNYIDEIQLQINEVHQRLLEAGWLAAARSVEAAAEDAGQDVTKLMAAADHACWHLEQLDKLALRKLNQYDRDCY